MTTVALQIFTAAYPTIANDIEIRVYNDADPLAILDSIRHTAPHGADTWSFAGLPRVNLIFRIFEMSGSSIVRQLDDDMNVVPGTSNGIAYRKTEQVQADVTIGFTSGVNVVTFDGTSGAPDWRGWDIDTLDRIGQDSMKRGVDYSYDKTLGKIQLLVLGDVFGHNEWLNAQFAIQVGQSTSSTPIAAPLFSTPQIITANYTINAGTDFGGLLILKPSGNYLELAFPDIGTIVPGRLLSIEFAPSAVNKCVKFIFQAGQTLDWLLGSRPDLYICPQERISIYKFIDNTGMAPVSQFRVFNAFGNFLKVGEHVTDDNAAMNVFNKIPFDGTPRDVLQFARLYNDYVENLPGGERVNFDDWATGNNKYKFSLANSSILANAGKFMVPNRLGQFERITDGTRKPGDYEGSSVGPFTANITGKQAAVQGGNGGSPNIVPLKSTMVPPFTGAPEIVNSLPVTTGSAETRPADVAIRKYLLV